MSDPVIRRAELTDLPYLYEICLKTANAGTDATGMLSDPNMVGHIFSAPYLMYEQDCCFVVDHNHKPKGYIVGCSDSNQYATWFENEWQPALQKKYPINEPVSALESFVFDCIHQPVDRHTFNDEFPAHLHINLLPDLQGYGLGKKLIQQLVATLKTKNVRGLHLGVDAKNTSAMAFYERIGFHRLDTKDGEFFGMDLT